MKKIFTVCLVLLGVHAFAQVPTISPAYYIDSQDVNFKKVYLDPNSIQSITVKKAPLGDMHSNGSIYITLKQPFASFLTLSGLIASRTDLSSKDVLYVIDDKLIKDTTGVRIDPSFITQISIFNMSDVHYIGDEGKKMAMIIIRTKAQPGQPEEKGTIRLRGATTALLPPSPGS